MGSARRKRRTGAIATPSATRASELHTESVQRPAAFFWTSLIFIAANISCTPPPQGTSNPRRPDG
jgi:hypothetical protein